MIDNATISILESMAFDGNAGRLTCGQLDRKQYTAVNEVLERIGGKWTRRLAAHVFPTDPRPLLGHILSTGELPPKNPLAFFATPATIARQMVERAEMDDIDPFVLEPSAGTGAICDAIKHAYPNAVTHAIEVDAARAAHLRSAGYAVEEGDFLASTSKHSYNRILMNPPFTLAGDAQAYITHIEKAFTLLSPGGRLVAIAPTGFTFRNDKRSTAFRAFVEKHGGFDDLGTGAFKASDTGVNTVMLWLDA